MGLYNMVLGTDPRAPVILWILRLKLEDFGRFRDAYVQHGLIAVLTRCGGGNRPDYVEVFRKMEKHPLFHHDENDLYDTTYCTFYFVFPQKGKYKLWTEDPGAWDLVELLRETPNKPTLKEQFDAAIEAMKQKPPE